MLDTWVAEGGLVQTFESLSDQVLDIYYKGCYEKLHVFRYLHLTSPYYAVLDSTRFGRFFWHNIPKWGKIRQIITKYTKVP
jgi:hypothetical protein